MLSINVSSFSKPSGYQLSTLPKPVVAGPTDVVINVHAASINPIDAHKAGGDLSIAVKEAFPYKICYDCAGVIAEIGPSVAKLRIGDEVYTRLPEVGRGSWSEYVSSPEYYVAHKPKSISFAHAASLPLAAMTALQAFRKYEGDLSGKTDFIPAGCLVGGTGCYACQLAKTVFKAGRVITTVSTSKVSKVSELLGEGIVDEGSYSIIDYTKSDPRSIIPAGSVDFILDTIGNATQYISLMMPKTGIIISIAGKPSGKTLQESSLLQRSDMPKLPWYVHLFLGVVDSVRKMRAKRWNVKHEFMILAPNAKDLDFLTDCVGAGKLKPVVGMEVNFREIEEVRRASMLAYTGKGGVGKTVIKII